jgi:hypothetical protein
MKRQRLRILVALLMVACGIAAVLMRTDLMPNQKAMVDRFIRDLLPGSSKRLVRGIVSSGDSFTALIGTQAVREGDSIDGVTIVKIYRDRVEFEKNGKRWTQGLGGRSQS